MHGREKSEWSKDGWGKTLQRNGLHPLHLLAVKFICVKPLTLRHSAQHNVASSGEAHTTEASTEPTCTAVASDVSLDQLAEFG